MKFIVLVFLIVLFAGIDFALGKPNNVPVDENIRLWITDYVNSFIYTVNTSDASDVQTQIDIVPDTTTVSEEPPELLTEPPKNTEMRELTNMFIEKIGGLMKKISIPLPFRGNNTILGKIGNKISNRLSNSNEILEHYMTWLNESFNDMVADKTDAVTPLRTDSICWAFTKEAKNKIKRTLIENGKDCFYQVVNVIKNDIVTMEKLQLEFNKGIQDGYIRINLASDIGDIFARIPYDGISMARKFPSCELKQIKNSLETLAEYINLFSSKCF